jgi:ubiquinone/menaquinone biosynthesis C-methylase UbiE
VPRLQRRWCSEHMRTFSVDTMQTEADKLTAVPQPERSRASVIPDDPWEAAYMRFETSEQEIRKFAGRLMKLGAAQWPRDAEIAELFCGRGNGLQALQRMGFTHLEGVDLSPNLVAQYVGGAKCYVNDCRHLPFASRSKDILVVQGGLHHLLTLPDDLEQTLAEMHRVLRTDGQLLVVEPWLTPFLSFVHLLCKNSLARRLSPKLDALAVMIQHERRTYEQWLSQPELISRLSRNHFLPVYESFGWGKWNFVGRPL